MSSFEARAIPPDDVAAMPSRAISTGPPRLTPLRESQLVDGHRRGDPEALNELLRAYQRRVFSVCYRMVRDVDQASDLAQDVLVKLIESLDQFDGRAKLSTWVFRIAVNCCVSHLRKVKLRRHASLDSSVESENRPAGEPTAEASRTGSGAPLGREHSAEDRVVQAEQQALLQRALLSLDPDMRAILVLRDMQDLDYEQIGAILAVPIGTVKSRLFRARSALRSEAERLGAAAD